MLTYHELYDSYHAAYRIVALLKNVPAGAVELERLRIMEFLFAVPGLLKNFRIPSDMRSERRALQAIPAPYERVENPPRLFFDVYPLHEAALRFLVTKGVIDADKFELGYASITSPTPAMVDSPVFAASRLTSKPGYTFLTTRVPEIPLDGPNGLKARTGLMEYRYDPQ